MWSTEKWKCHVGAKKCYHATRSVFLQIYPKLFCTQVCSCDLQNYFSHNIISTNEEFELQIVLVHILLQFSTKIIHFTVLSVWHNVSFRTNKTSLYYILCDSSIWFQITLHMIFTFISIYQHNDRNYHHRVIYRSYQLEATYYFDTVIFKLSALHPPKCNLTPPHINILSVQFTCFLEKWYIPRALLKVHFNSYF